MKKNLLFSLAICTAIFGCQKNETSDNLESGSELHATIDDATRTVMDENNNVRWSEGDQIVAFMKSSYGHKYQIKPSFVGETYADFSKVSSTSGDDLSAGVEWDHIVAYYPYAESTRCAKSGDNYAMTVTLPTEQTYEPDSFGNGSLPMVAVSEDNDITFKNVCGGMKLQLKGTQKVAAIRLEGKNSEKLSGPATVTAYTDGETKPAITMASGASTSVTLNCGSGIQLNESTATEFIIALPPVLFSKGFTVVVTDADGKTYTVETDKANTIVRSSILNMPAFKLGETPDSSDSENAVDMILFDLDKLTVVPGTIYAMTVDFEPFDASDKTLAWSSSNPSVASVDASGAIKALADGTSTITAVAVGGATATCTVTVKSCVVPSVDYEVDGVNYGKGIAIGDVVWAPVNCGYEAPTATYKGYPYGKLYQWGRKYGQGYNSSDASYPSGDNLVEGPVMPSVGLAEENKDKFYYNSKSPYDWSQLQKDDLWNAGSESAPVKTEYDPCPKGWRVPTCAELQELCKHSSSWLVVAGQNGLFFSGAYTYMDTAPSVFFPAAGDRFYSTAYYQRRGMHGNYWSTRTYKNVIWVLTFTSGSVGVQNATVGKRADGYSVRCVQEQ